MSLERHPKFPDLWKARIYAGGRKKDTATGKASNKRESYWFEGKEAEARAWYQDLLRSQRPVHAYLAPSLSQAYPEFCASYRNAVSETTFHDHLITWARHLEEFFGQYRPNQLTPQLIEVYKRKRLDATYLPGKPGQLPENDTPEETKKRRHVTRRTIQKELSYLSAVITWMTDPENNLALPLPFKIKGFKAAQVEPPAKIIPSRRDILLFLRACNGDYRHYRALFATAYYTGMRRAELFKLTGKTVDLQHDMILVKGKGGKQRTVPILKQLKPYLKRKPQQGLLFANKATGLAYDNMDWALERISARVGMPVMTMHVFRHTFAVHAIMSGVSLRTLQLVMGHSSIKVTEKYLKLVPRDLASDLSQFGRAKQRKPVHPRK